MCRVYTVNLSFLYIMEPKDQERQERVNDHKYLDFLFV